MAFTVFKDSDVDRVRYYLGIPLTEVKNVMVISAMEAAELLSQDAVKRVRLLLDELDAADREINTARPFSGQKFANGISWFDNRRLQDIKAEARRTAANIARVLALEVECDIWESWKGSQINLLGRS